MFLNQSDSVGLTLLDRKRETPKYWMCTGVIKQKIAPFRKQKHWFAVLFCLFVFFQWEIISEASAFHEEELCWLDMFAQP